MKEEEEEYVAEGHVESLREIVSQKWPWGNNKSHLVLVYFRGAENDFDFGFMCKVFGRKISRSYGAPGASI